MKKRAPCVICGNDSRFLPGPNGRMTPDGLAPLCVDCGSLERHRVFRGMWEAIRPVYPLSTYTCLQFADDRSVLPEWFGTFYLSVYGGINSMDIQEIPLPDHSLDVIICNHVLEHVPDDRKALREMLRILRPNGFLQLALPAPLQYDHTEDWGFPDEKRHQHYREYGKDIISLLSETLPGVCLFTLVARDFCTGVLDIVFLLSHTPVTRALTAVFPRSHFQRLDGASTFPTRELRLE